MSVAVSSKPYQFVGYWGYGQHPELEAVLCRVCASSSAGVQIRKGAIEDSPSIWAIAYLGIDQPLSATIPEEGVIATISACGRRHPSGASLPGDAWVRVQDGKLCLGREPFGRVPLYWTQIGQVIWFASTLQLLLPALGEPQVSIPALYGYACFSYVPTPLTPIEQIAAIPAGTELVWQGTTECRDVACNVSTPRTFEVGNAHEQWRESPELIWDEDLATLQLQTLLKDAIQRQIVDLPDEPVGVLLSGGIDSSIVTALLVQAGLKVRAYALDFGVEGYSEIAYAQQVADYLQIPLVRVPATPERLMAVVADTAQALDLPYGDAVTAPLFLLHQAAAQETRVVFNGENGDQLFAGWTNKPLIASGVYNQEHPAGGEEFNQQYLRTFARFYGYEAQIFTPTVYVQVRAFDLQEDLHSALNPEFCPTLLARLRRASLMLKGTQNIQPRATSIAFAHGLWVRSPFCDPQLTQWTFRLPGELVLRGACEKYILKRAVESWLPPEIVWREKRGMGVPLKPWYFQEMWSDLGYWLNPGVLRAEGRFSPHIAWQMLSGQLGAAMRDRYIGNNLWLLIMWQAWRTQVLGESAQGRSWDHPFWIPPRLWRGLSRLRWRVRGEE